MALEEPRAKYQQVADRLRDAIKSGEYPPGSALPSQTVLAKTYGLHQTMIGRAVAVLESEGLVRTEQGRPTYVQEIPTTKRVRRIDKDYRTNPGGSAYAEEMRRSGLTPRTELIELDEVDPPEQIAALFGLDEDERTVIRRRHMYADDIPIQIAISYIPIRYAGSKDLALPDTGPSGIYARLAERGFGPVRFVEEIEVRTSTPEESKFLRIPRSQIVFEVVRSAIDAEDRPVEACRNILSAAQWKLAYGWRQEP
jgi:GntR family transcriptional regulator